MSEKYVNYYIETLTSTLTDCIVRNVSMQANAKITEEVVSEQAKKIKDLSDKLNEMNLQVQNLTTDNSSKESIRNKDLEKQLTERSDIVTELQNQIRSLNSMKSDYDKIKNQVSQSDVFRNELIKSREENKNLISKYESEIELLNQQIVELKTPTKRKKSTVIKAELPLVNVEESVTPPQGEIVTRDGGSF